MGRIILMLFIIVSSLVENIAGNTLFESWSVNDHDGGICEGRCEMSVSCYMRGGRVEPAGNCHSIFQICCDYRNAEIPSSMINPIGDVDILDIAEISFNNTVDNDPQCGRSVVAKRRVVGGKEAGFGTFPWQALVRIGAARCGGALIGHNHVVTAGHCVHSLVEKRFENPTLDVIVFLGEYSLYGEDEPLPMQKMSVSKIFLHPKYRFTLQADRYDVAVLKLSHRVMYEPHILPICLPNQGKVVPEGTFAMVAGWGATDPDSPKRPSELQAVDVNVIDSRVCELWHQQNKIDLKLYDDMLCAGHENGGKDACQGDSGGPLMTKDPESGRWTLIGIVSAGFSCAKPGQPGIYHRMSTSSGWISHVVRISS